MLNIKSIDRRNFIKSTFTGIAGFFFHTSTGKNQIIPSKDLKTSKTKIIYRTLGKTGIKLPVISMGVMNSDNPNLVRAALDSGIVHLDTAHGYQRGRNEEMIGKVIQGRPRDSYVIATKVEGRPFDRKTGFFTEETTGETFLEKFDISLKRLGLDYVDILYLHNIYRREAALFEPLLKALEKAKKEGKTRFIGVSTHRHEPEVIQAVIDSNIYDVVLTSYNFKQDHYLEVRRAIANASQAGIGIIAMKTIAGGYFDREKTKPVNTKAALKWVLQDPNVHTAIPGFTTFDQMELDLSVMEDLTLTDSEKQDLRLGALKNGLYCQGCEKCLYQCKRHLPIPDIMRAYMYAHGYKNPSVAQELLFSLNLPENICGDCEQCSVSCTKGFNVSKRIKDIARLMDIPSDFIV